MQKTKSHFEKFRQLLCDYITGDVVIAFSGGVDSSLLVKVAKEEADKKNHKVYAVSFQTTLHPAGDEKITRKLAADMGVELHVESIDELANAGIVNNPENRCYLCKKFLFTRLRKIADGKSISIIMDGTNSDDLMVHRPGLKALKELQVLSPLAEAGMTKGDVRKMAAEYGLSVADRPAAPCLATRFPYGTKLSIEMLGRVEMGEEFIRSLGFYNVRLRVYGDSVRIEVDLEDLEAVMLHREAIVKYLKKLGYSFITIDLEGFRSGSMDLGLSMKMK